MSNESYKKQNSFYKSNFYTTEIKWTNENKLLFLLFLLQKELNTFVLLLSTLLASLLCATGGTHKMALLADMRDIKNTPEVVHWGRKLDVVHVFGFVHWAQNVFTFCLVRCGLWRKTLQHSSVGWACLIFYSTYYRREITVSCIKQVCSFWTLDIQRWMKERSQ